MFGRYSLWRLQITSASVNNYMVARGRVTLTFKLTAKIWSISISFFPYYRTKRRKDTLALSSQITPSFLYESTNMIEEILIEKL